MILVQKLLFKKFLPYLSSKAVTYYMGRRISGWHIIRSNAKQAVGYFFQDESGVIFSKERLLTAVPTVQFTLDAVILAESEYFLVRLGAILVAAAVDITSC